jgi:hypothetical protein
MARSPAGACPLTADCYASVVSENAAGSGSGSWGAKGAMYVHVAVMLHVRHRVQWRGLIMVPPRNPPWCRGCLGLLSR